MSLGEELTDRVDEIFRNTWTPKAQLEIPEADDLSLHNEAVEFAAATVLYSDLSGSTALVNASKWTFAAEVYKSFLYCAARVIGAEGGTVTAYDGDRVMAIFIGDGSDTSAAKTALKINYCVAKIVNPLLRKQYPQSTYEIKHVTGVDVSSIRAARTGVRGANDLVWVGRAANYAAKLTELTDYSSWLTDDVFTRLHDTARNSNGKPMWEARIWTAMNGLRIHRSNWTWKVG